MGHAREGRMYTYDALVSFRIREVIVLTVYDPNSTNVNNRHTRIRTLMATNGGRDIGED